MTGKKYIQLSVLIILCAGVGIASYYIFKDIKAKREISQLKDALRDSPEKIDSKQRLGLLYMYQGDYKKAEGEFLGILSMDPYNTRALTSIGMMYYNKGESERALTYWRSILEVEPDNKFIWGLVNKVGKNNGKGIVSHGDVQAISVEWEKHYKEGQDSYQKKDYKKAIEHFKKALESNPDDFRTHFNIGTSYYEMKDLKEAVKSWQNALKYKKDDLLTMRLITLAQQGMDRKEAIGEIQEALKKEPSNWEFHARLADGYAKDKSKVKDAEREYLEALRLSPSNGEVYDRLIDLSVKLDEYDKAVGFAKKRLKAIGQDDSSAQRKLNSLLAYRKLKDKGRTDWTMKGIAHYNEMSPVSEDGKTLFYMDKYEVTNGQYQAFLKDTGHAAPVLWSDAEIKGKESYPVTRVSWYDALMYCKWAGKRLPTEEEWIKAGWAQGKTNYPWGVNIDPGIANTAESGFAKPVPVGSYVSQNGVYDMVGNVMEWTSTEKAQPSTGDTYKIKKGGSFMTDPQTISSIAHWAVPPTQWDDETGFRCAR